MTEKFNMKLAEDHTSLVLFIVAAPMLMQPCDAEAARRKVAQGKI